MVRYYVISHVLTVGAVIFDLPVTLMSDCVHTSSAVLVDTENVGGAFGTSLLSCVKAEIKVLPVKWRHFGFIISDHFSQHRWQ